MKGSDDQIGAIITTGPTDWQIIQCDERRMGQIDLSGRWISQSGGIVEVRMVREDSGLPVGSSLDWQPANTHSTGTWSASLKDVPAGGLYRLETRFRQAGNLRGEWSERGDMRHFLGVGDVWVIAGQSNSAGYGHGPFLDPPELGIHLFRNSMVWALAAQPLSDTTDIQHPVSREGTNAGHSPYLHFARLLKQQLGYPIGLVQTSLGGSMLAQWNTDDSEQDIDLFSNMVKCVQAVGGKVKGIVWYQGESEASLGLGAAYLELFTRAVTAWREALTSPELAVVTVQLNRFFTLATPKLDQNWSQVREAQRQAARRIPGVLVTPTFDLPLSDFIHTSPAGNMLLAERMAALALGKVYGLPIVCQAPDLESVYVSADRRVLYLLFAPVLSHIESNDPNANCFRVEDELGELPVEHVIYPQDASVQLVLSRPLQGQAVVHGGFGVNPACVPMDMERNLPILGFYGIKVEELPSTTTPEAGGL